VTQAVRRFLASALVGASLVGLAGCGNNGAAGNSTGSNAAPPPPAANAAPAGPAAAPANPPPAANAAAAPATPSASPPAEASAAGPQRYCGTIHNSTLDQDAQGEADIDAGPAFSGNIIVSGRLEGGGRFQGTSSGGECSGYAASSGLSFSGACPAGGVFNGTYSINNQKGEFHLSTAGCR